LETTWIGVVIIMNMHHSLILSRLVHGMTKDGRKLLIMLAVMIRSKEGALWNVMRSRNIHASARLPSTEMVIPQLSLLLVRVFSVASNHVHTSNHDKRERGSNNTQLAKGDAGSILLTTLSTFSGAIIGKIHWKGHVGRTFSFSHGVDVSRNNERIWRVKLLRLGLGSWYQIFKSRLEFFKAFFGSEKQDSNR
jgi:hypothetical protein